jgi:hypothetical protein
MKTALVVASILLAFQNVSALAACSDQDIQKNLEQRIKESWSNPDLYISEIAVGSFNVVREESPSWLWPLPGARSIGNGQLLALRGLEHLGLVDIEHVDYSESSQPLALMNRAKGVMGEVTVVATPKARELAKSYGKSMQDGTIYLKSLVHVNAEIVDMQEVGSAVSPHRVVFLKTQQVYTPEVKSILEFMNENKRTVKGKLPACYYTNLSDPINKAIQVFKLDKFTCTWEFGPIDYSMSSDGPMCSNSADQLIGTLQ